MGTDDHQRNLTDGVAESAPVVLHGTAVSCAGRGVLFIGPSGSGKSSAALVLLGLGVDLIADDRTQLYLCPTTGRILLTAPPTLPEYIEARGTGLLPARLVRDVPLALVVDMGRRETHRLPEKHGIAVFGRSVVLLHASESVHFPYAVYQFVKGLKVTGSGI